jgi:hypothetical protein
MEVIEHNKAVLADWERGERTKGGTKREPDSLWAAKHLGLLVIHEIWTRWVKNPSPTHINN